VGDTFHITSDESLTWNQIHVIVAAAAGAEPKLVHVPSTLIAAFDPEWGDSLLGDKAHSMVFDNTKIKRLVPDFTATIPYSQGGPWQIAWYDADPKRRVVDDGMNALFDRIIAAQESALPGAAG